MSLHFQTAGESHGPGLVATVSGMPAGTPVDEAFINAELARRQGGYGRGGRQNIESDRIEVLTGVRRGVAIGSPVTMLIRNRDSRLDDLERTPPVHRPRPGHADLAGSIKYLSTDCRETLERASARETAARVAAGALARCLLREFGIASFGMVRAIGGHATAVEVDPSTIASLAAARDASDTYCPDPDATGRQVKAIHDANPQLPSGTYSVDFDPTDGQPARNVYCDMTTQGGAGRFAPPLAIKSTGTDCSTPPKSGLPMASAS